MCVVLLLSLLSYLLCNYFLLLSVFFFFKQKTAYEMRISDWSSDVCSSDLRRQGVESGGVTGALAGRERPDQRDRRGGRTVRNLACRKIGRASCRERVCQYV